MGKSSGNCGNSYSANRSSGCPYSGNRSNCSSDNRRRGSEPCSANESRARGCESETLNRAASCRSQNAYSCEYAAPACDGVKAPVCCEHECSRAAADAACGYAWRGMEQENCAEEYESCPAELHVHEAQGSTQAAGERCALHTHRFASVTCEPVMLRDGRHAHKLTFRTDSCEGHCHEFSGMTTGEYEICDCHVHYIEGETSRQAGHCHSFRLATHIGNPVEN